MRPVIGISASQLACVPALSNEADVGPEVELGFRIVPVYNALRAAIDWFRANGYAPAAIPAPVQVKAS